MSFDISFHLPKGWAIKTVAELVTDKIIEKPLDGNHGGIHPKASDYVESGVPFIMASDLEAGRVNFNSCKYISVEQAKTLRKGFAKEKDVLLSHKATIGRTAIVQESNNDFIVLTPQITYYRIKDNLQLNNIYLKSYFDSHFFQSIIKQWAGAGSTRAYIGITDQLKLPIIIPPIETQRKIAAFADSINRKIYLNSQINETLESICLMIFKSWFIDFDPVKAKMVAILEGKDPELAAMSILSGRTEAEIDQMEEDDRAELKATAELFPNDFVESEVGKIPKGWTLQALYDTAEFINGVAFKAKDFIPTTDGLPIIKIAELKQGISLQTKYTNIKLDKKYQVKSGDVFYSWSGSPETSLDVFKWFGECGWLNQHIFKINTKNDGQTYFVYYLLKYLKPKLIRLATNKQTTGLGHITVADMKKLHVIKPEEKLYSSYMRKITSFYEEDSLLKKMNIDLILLRDTLLPKILIGEIDVAALNEVLHD
ncbi:restriction endonuclease subunit S [Acinetobacter pittii]|uniref:restriction endonuclease subunit S n=1 Tax=Acinetobacter pittii TaxID=48296 RepID=UPI003AA8CF49